MTRSRSGESRSPRCLRFGHSSFSCDDDGHRHACCGGWQALSSLPRGSATRMAAARMKLLQNQREVQMRSGPSRRWCCHSGRRGGPGRAPWRRATCCWVSSRRTGGPGGFLSSGISIERAHEECHGIGVQDAGASLPLPSSGSGLETDVPFFGSCKLVFEVAVEFSRNIGCSFISLEHLASALFTLFTLDDPTTNNLLRRWTPITGIRVGVLSIYKLRAFRRETLLWINLLNKVSTPLSISIMSNSSVCNCSSSHATLFFWNVLETRDHLVELGISICFDRRFGDDSSIETNVGLYLEPVCCNGVEPVWFASIYNERSRSHGKAHSIDRKNLVDDGELCCWHKRHPSPRQADALFAISGRSA